MWDKWRVMRSDEWCEMSGEIGSVRGEECER